MRYLIMMLLFNCYNPINAQELRDSLATANVLSDSIVEEQVKGDTSYLLTAKYLSERASSIISSNQKNIVNDFQILRHTKSSDWIYVWIFISFLILAVFKNVFKTESQEFITQVLNVSNTNAIGRTKQNIFSGYSFILILVFVVNASIISALSIQYFFHDCRYNTLQLSIILIFLFTFFIIFKVITVNVFGFIFEEYEAAKFYLHDLLMIIQTVGISIFPLIIISTLITQNNFSVLFFVTLIVLVFFFAYFVLRGLSTSMSLMYKSLYHFLLYICIEEILSVFLFIKLLTKIAF